MSSALSVVDSAASDVSKSVYAQLLQLAVDFTTQIDVGYTDCLVT